jgi:hypothetical protein
MASGWSGQNEDICPSIKKSMAKQAELVIIILYTKNKSDVF